MITCVLCGMCDPSPVVRFCSNCGPDAKWSTAETDDPLNVERYWESVCELKLEPDLDDAAFTDLSVRIRARLKVSFRKHCELVALIDGQLARAEPLSTFSIEFDDNVHDSIAGHDTQLRFRLTNNSQTDLLRFSIEWPFEKEDSRRTAGKVTKFIKPGEQILVSNACVFERSGPKEIAGMRVTVIDPAFQAASFVVSPFSFNIGVDTRGAIDLRQIEPRWRILRRILLLDRTVPQSLPAAVGDKLPTLSPASLAVHQATAETLVRSDELLRLARCFVSEVEGIVGLLATGERIRYVASQDLRLTHLDEISSQIGEVQSDHVLAIFLDDAKQGMRDTDGVLINDFNCEATCISRRGISVYSAISSQSKKTWNVYEWSQLWSSGIRFFRQNFGTTASIVVYGFENTRKALPGLRFDLRRYHDVADVDARLVKAEQVLDELCAIAPFSINRENDLIPANELPDPFRGGAQPNWLTGLIPQDSGNIKDSANIENEHGYSSSPSRGAMDSKLPTKAATWMTGLVHGDYKEIHGRENTDLCYEVEPGRPVSNDTSGIYKKDTSWSLDSVIVPKMTRMSRGSFEVWSVDGTEHQHEIRLLDSGKFHMGDLSGRGYPEEKPAREVNIVRPFALSTMPVTRSFWKQLMGNSPPKPKNGNKDHLLPATNVSWLDVVTFCNACSRALGLEEAYVLKILRGRPGTPQFEGTAEWKGLSCQGVRLPTEAEWEYACRAGTTTEFSAGNTEAELHPSGWYAKNSDNSCQRVGRKAANRWGFRDMHGNVWEWCNDFFAPYEPDETIDPTGPDQGNSRVARGGAYDIKARMLRSSARRAVSPQTREDNIGFRVARSIG